ncbi:MAG: AAA family ATPase [Planctomycetota bacterium]|nr:AAA family ATPase [Planctomycetota bacterium]
MKPLYVVGTQRDVGKTTFCIGLIRAFQKRGLSVGYTKPLGQRVSSVAGQPVHDDALVVSQAMGTDADHPSSMVVPLTQGRVEKEIYDLHVPELTEKVTSVCRRLRDEYDAVVVEGMGHVAMGSCLKLSSAEVARSMGARALLISGGGIGRAIDDISLCATFLTARGADLMGAVVNKVWPEKFNRVKDATTKGLDNLGIRSYGTVPYEDMLVSPTIRQVVAQLDCAMLCGDNALDNRVGAFIVAAMEPDHMVSYLKDRVLVITPGDRSDNILAVLSTHVLEAEKNPVAGIVLTGGFRPPSKVINLLAGSGLPAILCREHTYTLATKLKNMTFKITPQDTERIDTAICLVEEYADVDGILAGMKE